MTLFMFGNAPSYVTDGFERAIRLEELKRNAFVDMTRRDEYEVLWWIEQVEIYYREGDWAYNSGRLETAYINFMRGFSIMAVVKGHLDYLEIETHPLYLTLKRRTQGDVGEKLQAVALELENRFHRVSNVARFIPPHSVVAQHDLKVEPKQLARWLTVEKELKKVLILDIRPRQDFEYGCIKHQWIIQIEPSALEPNVNSDTIKSALSNNPPAERNMFSRRKDFDIIVYYDQSSRFLHHVANPLIYLRSALSVGRPAPRTPLMLDGGFDAWREVIGEKGVFQFPQLKLPSFIDNPFNRFTATSSQIYERPPAAANAVPTHHILRPKPSPSISDSGQRVRHSATAPPFNYPAPAGQSSPQGSQTFSDVQAGVTGLKNLGNTCYINSIVQCLCGTAPLARYFVSGAYRKHLNRQNKKGSGGELADSFAALLQIMWKQEYNFVSPMTFRDKLRRWFRQFEGNDQQDSQELLNLLLDNLHEDTNLAHGKQRQQHEISENSPDWEASSMAWDNFLAQNDSRIVHLFHGQYRSRLTCLKCNTTSTTYNTFMSLSLPIPDKKYRISSVTLDDCLQHFVKQETLGKADAWHCPTCRKPRRANKQLTLSRLPDILLIHLKRFDGPFQKKLDSNVQCPTKDLDLSSYISDSFFPPNQKTQPLFKYDLYAVSNHEGSLLTSGHYTACVRQGYRGKWLHFDDTVIHEMDENKVEKIVSREAYNLFYVRSTVQ